MKCNNCNQEIKQDSYFCPYCGKSPFPPAPAHHISPGTVLHDKYIVGNAIGEGGFGITYNGYDRTLDIKVAIKEFFPSGCANRNNTLTNEVTLNYTSQGDYYTKGKENFLREARSIAKFSGNDGIVLVRDYFTDNNTAYIVMEYLDGVNLNRYVYEHGAMPANTVFNLMLPLMKALQKMHFSGIIHRDISPDNIMYLTDGKLKLMDFGSARYFAGNEMKTMSVLLKPGYAPYEQYGRNLTQGPWTDVYGLCATIYKCITGVTPQDSIDRSVNDELKKPSELNVSISPALESVLMKGVAIKSNDRWQSMDELIEAVGKALDAPDTAVVSEPPKSEPPTSAAPQPMVDDSQRTVAADAAGFIPQSPTPQPIPQNNNIVYHTNPAKPAKKKRAGLVITILASIIVLAIIGGVITYTYIASHPAKNYTIYTISGDSMENTLFEGDRVKTEKNPETIKSGDIIVVDMGDGAIVTRTIATGGQTVTLDYDDDTISVDGAYLYEPYLNGSSQLGSNRGDSSSDYVTRRIPEGKIFVMGDNRAVSHDSRHSDFGLVDESQVLAKSVDPNYE